MAEVTIMGMNINPDWREERGGKYILAHFDFTDGHYTFQGCALSRLKTNDALRVMLPLCHHERTLTRRIGFTDEELMAKVEAAASNTFKLMAGTSAILEGHDEL